MTNEKLGAAARNIAADAMWMADRVRMGEREGTEPDAERYMPVLQGIADMVRECIGPERPYIVPLDQQIAEM